MKILMDANLDIIQMNNEGLEPLHAAVLGDSLSCFQMLLEARGRKRNYPDYILKKTKQGQTCLHLAVKYSSREIFYYILTQIEVMDDPDSRFRTALMYAVDSNNGEFAETLMERGSNIFATDADGNDLICYAVKRNNITLFNVSPPFLAISNFILGIADTIRSRRHLEEEQEWREPLVYCFPGRKFKIGQEIFGIWT